jgi:hypothetical protein
MNVCTPQPRGGLQPPWSGGAATGSCCDSCARGDPCSCGGARRDQLDWAQVLGMDHN